MTQLTREQIEAFFDECRTTQTMEEVRTLALSGLDAQKRIAELEEALKPFAEVQSRLVKTPKGSSREDQFIWTLGKAVRPYISYGDLDKAARALNTPKDAE